MVICIDLDGTLVSMDRAYTDLSTPMTLMPGALEALGALKRAGHVLVLYSARANRSLWENPQLDPLVRAGVRRVDMEQWEERRELHKARYDEMLRFVDEQLPGVFDAVDDGAQGKPNADLFIDDRAIRFSSLGGAEALSWRDIADRYGALATGTTG